MNRETLLNALNNELLEKKMGDRLDISWDIRGVIKTALETEQKFGNLLDRFCVDKDNDNKSEYYFRYRGHFICSINVKKQQGEYHRGYFSSRYDWYYNGFEIKNDFDLETRISEIDNEITRTNLINEKKLKEMLVIYKDLKSKYGKQATEIISYLWANKWTLERLCESEDN